MLICFKNIIDIIESPEKPEGRFDRLVIDMWIAFRGAGVISCV